MNFLDKYKQVTIIVEKKVKGICEVNIMAINIQSDLNKLGLEVDTTREEIDKAYEQAKENYMAGDLAFEDWYEIELAYTELCCVAAHMGEAEIEERVSQRRDDLVEAERVRRITAAIKEEEERKGPLWAFLENVKITEIGNMNVDFWQYMEEKVSSVMKPKKASKYKKFLKRFKEMWDEIYPRICKFEYDLLVDGDLTSSCSFSVGMDELTKSRFPMGKYQDVFTLGCELSGLIPDSDPYYIIDRHFALIAEFVGLEYSVSSFGGCLIYSFDPSTRLKKYRNEYLEQFGEEVRSGKRKNPYVDNNELLSYVTKSLRPHNSYVKDKN